MNKKTQDDDVYCKQRSKDKKKTWQAIFLLPA